MAKLYVIAGHGDGDPGAVGNGYREADQVRKLAKRIVELGNGQVDHYPYDQNCYADNGLSRINPGCPVIECHMDSGVSSARGGHVIISSRSGGVDRYDEALASLMREIFPGRSNLIVERGDLQNPNVAASRGINYRLVEFGFISNATDANIFNTRIDDIARGVLKAFGINAEEDKPVNDSGFYYRAHVSEIGWQSSVRDGMTAGTVGKSLPIECLKIRPPEGLELTVKAHIANVGWKSYKVIRDKSDPEIGTTGKSQQLEAIEVVVDKNTTGKKLSYRVHIATVGWVGWTEAGYATGTTGLQLGIEAIQFKLV